jgi:hypothetical protein
LDRDIAIKCHIAGTIEDAHAAVAYFVEQLVARRAENGVGSLGDGVHERSSRVGQVFGPGLRSSGSPAMGCG